MREVGDPASDWKSYSDSVQKPLPVTQGNFGQASGLQERCVSIVTPLMLIGDIGIAYVDCKHAIVVENDVGREEGRERTVGVGLMFR